MIIKIIVLRFTKIFNTLWIASYFPSYYKNPRYFNFKGILHKICKRLLHASISASINLDHISDLKLIWPLKNGVICSSSIVSCSRLSFRIFFLPNVFFSMMMDQHIGYGKDKNTANLNSDFLFHHCLRMYIQS